MSNKIINIKLTDDDAFINDKNLGSICVDAARGTVDYIDQQGNPEHIIIFSSSGPSSAYMEKAIYDTNDNGIVDNSDQLGGIGAIYYATKNWVLTNAGNMLKSVYDTDDSGIVDDAEKLGGQLPSYYASVDYVNATFGDMFKSTYDTNDSGIVDDAEKLGGQLPSYYSNYINLINKPKFGDLEDTSFSSLQQGDITYYNGSNWINSNSLDLGTF